MSQTLTLENELTDAGPFSLRDWLLDTPADWYLARAWEAVQATQHDAIGAQERAWKRMRESLRGTALWKDLKLENVVSYRDYVKKLPVGVYENFEPYVQRIMAGERHVLFRGRPLYYLVTSGTSGFNSKVIPCNDAMVSAFRDMQRDVAAVAKAGPTALRLSARKFVYGSKPVLEYVDGIPKGYVSGVLATRMPGVLRRRTFPTENTLHIDDWSAKVAAIAGEVANVDVRAVAAVPSYFINIAKDMMAHMKISSLSEMWPNLDLLLYSGTAIANYQAIIDGLAGRPLHYLGAYISTEAPMGFQLAPSRHHTGMHFNLNSVLFSFHDVDHPEGPVLALDELKAGGEYLVNVGTPNGILQYAMKDYVRVNRVRPTVEFEVQGRYGSAINVAAEKVSHNEVNQAVARMQESTGIVVEHFFVYPSENNQGNPCYEWVFALPQMREGVEAQLASAIDKALMDVSGDYHEARLESNFIAPPRVRVISAEVTRGYFLSHSMRGQLKMKTAFKSRDEFTAFAQGLDLCGGPGIV